MITPMRMSAPTPTTPQRPAQAAPARRKRVWEPEGIEPRLVSGGVAASGIGCE